jgi:putative molybdopterin biosynthesis protein
MLSGLSHEAGCETLVRPILPDDPERLAVAVQAAAAQADLVLMVAGTSAGRHDHAADVLRTCGQIIVSGVAMRPGHPAILAVVDRTPVMACPGYPVSAALAFEQLAGPLIASLQGTNPPRNVTTRACLALDIAAKPGARHLVRARLGTVDGRRVAIPMRGGASVLSSLAHADALLPLATGQERDAAPATVDAELLRARAQIDNVLIVAGAPDLSLELLASVVAETDLGFARIGFCELAALEAVRLVQQGLCHAAAISNSAVGPPPHERLQLNLRFATTDVGMAVAPGHAVPVAATELLRSRALIAVGPHGTPGRHVLEGTMPEPRVEIVESRSEAGALAILASGYTDGAVISVPAAARGGTPTAPLGRAGLDLVVNPRAAARDPLLRMLRCVMRSRPLAVALERAGYAAGQAVWAEQAIEKAPSGSDDPCT